MRSISQDANAVIVKKRALGYKETEIAEKLGISQSAVAQRLASIRLRRKRDEDAFLMTLLFGVTKRTSIQAIDKFITEIKQSEAPAILATPLVQVQSGTAPS